MVPRKMDERICVSISVLQGVLEKQPNDHHTHLMTAALQALEQLLQAGRDGGLHGTRLIDILRRDAGSLMYERKIFFEELDKAQRYLHRHVPSNEKSPIHLPHVYFLSYSRSDNSAADSIDRVLQKSGSVVWRDIRDLLPGDDHLEIIAAKVDACSTFVALYGGSYARSDYCKGELDRALKRNRTGSTPCRIVLMRLDETDVPLNFGTRTWEWGRTPREQDQAIRRLLQNEPDCLSTE